MDTEADVTIISNTKWPPQWGLKPTAGKLSGIGRATPFMQSANNIIAEGPDGHTASIKPFIVPSGFTFWGRDVLSQWGTRLEIPSPPWGF